MLAPSSKSALSGSGKTRSAGTTVYSWAVPLAGRPSRSECHPDAVADLDTGDA